MTAQPWALGPLLAIDTETTGIDPATDRIVEIAAVTIGPAGDIVHAWSNIIDPGIPIPDEAAAVHGITTERARTEGCDPRTALHVVGDVIGSAGCPVVIYNARFDWPLLHAEAARHGITWPDAAILDPHVLDKHLDRYRRGSRKLVDVAAHYGITLAADDAHGARADATAAGQIMRAMLHREPAMAETSLEAMQLWQERWHDDQRSSFADYMRRTKDPQFSDELGWPIPRGIAA